VNLDFAERLSALSAAGAEFVVVGAHALAAHGVARATGDIDILVNPTASNAERVLEALARFGAPLFDLTKSDLEKDDTVFQIGVPPGRIDILTGISGVSFDRAWRGRLMVNLQSVPEPVAVLGRSEFIANKRAAGRPKDLLDLALLGEE
jgi:hypothetical protein